VPSGPAVALVGARRATGYGQAIAAWLADDAARRGVTIVSGGAVGIDAAAHEAALEAGGRTVVVLGCGHAVPYPRPHTAPGGLFDRVLDAGGSLASELLPHEPPRPGQVRARNRIVAGLVDAVVVVEGAARSGSLLTADAAAERGRTVLAVPGDVRAPGSAAPHRLLTEGVAPCTGPADLLAALPARRIGDAHGDQPGASGPSAGTADAAAVGDRVGAGVDPPGAASKPTVTTSLPGAVHALLATSWPRPVPLDRLATANGGGVPALLAALTRARIAGEVAETVDGVRLRRAPP
jgi:DNA processing protein